MQRELPILFNTDMVTAIVRQINPKTATRRVIKGFIPSDAIWGYTMFTPKGCISCRGTFADGYGEKFFRLPCRLGDILYVRETWRCWRAHRYEATADIMFKAGGEGIRIFFPNGSTDSANRYDYDQFVYKWYGEKWRPSIHMPKEAARIWLKVTDVKPEHLQDMTLDDFLNEGIGISYEAFNDPENAYMQAKSLFTDVWNSTVNKKERELYGWNANPWVWVIKFERVKKPERMEEGR